MREVELRVTIRRRPELGGRALGQLLVDPDEVARRRAGHHGRHVPRGRDGRRLGGRAGRGLRRGGRSGARVHRCEHLRHRSGGLRRGRGARAGRGQGRRRGRLRAERLHELLHRVLHVVLAHAEVDVTELSDQSLAVFGGGRQIRHHASEYGGEVEPLRRVSREELALADAGPGCENLYQLAQCDPLLEGLARLLGTVEFLRREHAGGGDDPPHGVAEPAELPDGVLEELPSGERGLAQLQVAQRVLATRVGIGRHCRDLLRLRAGGHDRHGLGSREGATHHNRHRHTLTGRTGAALAPHHLMRGSGSARGGCGGGLLRGLRRRLGGRAGRGLRGGDGRGDGRGGGGATSGATVHDTHVGTSFFAPRC